MRVHWAWLALVVAVGIGFALAVPARAALVSGNPVADGWNFEGNSLQKGLYVTGTANYAFDAYTAGLTVSAGSNLEISDGALSWLAGDIVLGVGGRFQTITAAAAGWAAITGTGQNSLLPTSSPYSGPKLQAKFGTNLATWSTSTVAPSSPNGNGNSSSANGGGRVQIRTSGFFRTGSPTPGQTEPWTWDGNSGDLLVLDKSDHILWAGDAGIDKRVARMIWIWDDTLKQVSSWELLLNVSLMDRLYPSFAGPLPAIGDQTIMTVQNGDAAFTDALVAIQAVAPVVPEPSALAIWALLAVATGTGMGVKRLKSRTRFRLRSAD
jgi:hypothetical protein